MHTNNSNFLLISMPFAGVNIPSIQLSVLDAYLKERNINIDCLHLYTKMCELIGLTNYNFLINPPIDSYTAQMVFTKYVFPNHWEKNKDEIKKYFQRITQPVKKSHFQITFDEFINKTDEFYQWTFENINWDKYDLIGFTLNYGQFIPSLAIAKRIKEIDSDKKIIFGGSRVTGDLGIRVLSAFEYIDYAISGEGEESLYQLITNPNDNKIVPNLIYRENKEIKWNKTDFLIDINNLPIPDFNSFFKQLSICNDEIQQFFSLSGKLPIEISRGCWWNKCTFCNHNIQYPKYREKNVDKIINEISILSDNYQVLDFQIIGNSFLKNNYRYFLEKIIDLNKDLNFVSEVRAGQLCSDDYILMKKAGFNTIQTGVESFSINYLNKMNKGTRVIDNIAALKYCMENNISNAYNLIINYPNEESIDFNENKEVIYKIKHYLNPPSICNLKVVYKSPIYCNMASYNIEDLEVPYIDKLMIPKEILDKQFNFVYDFKLKKQIEKFNWENLVDNWKMEHNLLVHESYNSNLEIDKKIFYFVDGGNYIKIYDKRNFSGIQVIKLDEIEREIFLSCINVITLEELINKFSNIIEEKLISILSSFEENGIIFKEDDLFLSLPLRNNIKDNNFNIDKIKESCLIYNSGNQRSL